MSVCVSSLDISFTHFIHTDYFNDDFVSFVMSNKLYFEHIFWHFVGFAVILFSYVKFPTMFTLKENFLRRAQILKFS